MKRRYHALGAAGIVAVAAVMASTWRSGGAPTPAPVVQQAAPPEPIDEPPAGTPAAAVPDVHSAAQQAEVERDWSVFPKTLLSPRQEAEARETWACIRAVRKLRPVTGGTDAEQLARIEKRRAFDAWAARIVDLDMKLNGGPGPTPDLIDPGVPCPEERLRREYEERRQEDLRTPR